MSDLQTALIAIGVCVVAGVYAFNWWQEHKFRRRVELAFERKHDDVLMPAAQPALDEPAEERIEPRLDSAREPAAAAAAPPPSVAQAAVSSVDPVIDFVVDVELPTASASVVLQNELKELAASWDKPVRAAGYDAASATWQTPPDHRAAYARWRFAVQMSNRAGRIDRDRLRSFVAAVERWADTHDALEVKAADPEAANSMAMQLDRFCADVDIAIGINVIAGPGNSFAGTKVRSLAEAGGMKLESDGVFYLRNDKGMKIYTLDNHEPMPFVPEQMKTLTTSGVTFLIDVPCVEEGIGAFENMLATARNFAATLGGTLVDDNRRVLTDEAIDKIRRQLTGILAKMEAGQIPAGGARALRLFS